VASLKLRSAADQLRQLTQVVLGHRRPLVGRPHVAVASGLVTASDPDLSRCESEECLGASSDDISSECSGSVLHSAASTVIYAGNVGQPIASKEEELASKVRQLETDLSLAGQECKGLQKKLESTLRDLRTKECALRELESEMDELRNFNRSRNEEMDQIRMMTATANAQSSRAVSLSIMPNEELALKCKRKDFLLKSLAEATREQQADICLATIARRLREATYRPSYTRSLDFDLQNLVDFVETGRLPQVSTINKLHKVRQDNILSLLSTHLATSSLKCQRQKRLITANYLPCHPFPLQLSSNFPVEWAQTDSCSLGGSQIIQQLMATRYDCC